MENMNINGRLGETQRMDGDKRRRLEGGLGDNNGGGQFLGLSGDRKGKNGRGGGGDLEVISESIRLRDVKAVREGERRAE